MNYPNTQSFLKWSSMAMQCNCSGGYWEAIEAQRWLWMVRVTTVVYQGKLAIHFSTIAPTIKSTGLILWIILNVIFFFGDILDKLNTLNPFSWSTFCVFSLQTHLQVINNRTIDTTLHSWFQFYLSFNYGYLQVQGTEVCFPSLK